MSFYADFDVGKKQVSSATLTQLDRQEAFLSKDAQ